LSKYPRFVCIHFICVFIMLGTTLSPANSNHQYKTILSYIAIESWVT